MAKEKKNVHRIQMTEGKRNIPSFFRNMILNQQKIFRRHGKISLAEPSKI